MLIKDIRSEIEELRIENDSQLFEANELAKKIKKDQELTVVRS